MSVLGYIEFQSKERPLMVLQYSKNGKGGATVWGETWGGQRVDFNSVEEIKDQLGDATAEYPTNAFYNQVGLEVARLFVSAGADLSLLLPHMGDKELLRMVQFDKGAVLAVDLYNRDPFHQKPNMKPVPVRAKAGGDLLFSVSVIRE